MSHYKYFDDGFYPSPPPCPPMRLKGSSEGETKRSRELIKEWRNKMNEWEKKFDEWKIRNGPIETRFEILDL